VGVSLEPDFALKNPSALVQLSAQFGSGQLHSLPCMRLPAIGHYLRNALQTPTVEVVSTSAPTQPSSKTSGLRSLRPLRRVVDRALVRSQVLQVFGMPLRYRQLVKRQEKYVLAN
jgi:hypothetical protein